MKGKKRPRLSSVALVALFAFVAGIIFVPYLLFGAIIESGIETRSEEALKNYVEQLDRQLEKDSSGDLWRQTPGPGVIRAARPDKDSLVISTAVTVEAGGIFFNSGYEVRCYDIVFTNIGAADQAHELRKVPGCPQELRGPGVPL
ncbi:hypothetical protein GCM10022224_026410 [Nonomuraea antimicrobica]|uniref:DUF4845 domain-containing protein n=1 Tax=Nonomuraea antimicrobica TaxID=561173 RepID=A0ABP7BK00_9ACTN